MLRSSLLVAFCLPLLLGGPCFAQQPPQLSGYQLNWADNFDGNSLDESRWTPVFSTNPTNNSLQAYLPANVVVGGGNLILLSEDNPFGVFNYRSGQVITKSLHRYGRFEVRANLPTSQGMWPAIWLLSDAPWPSQGEIDIMENRGNQPFLTSSALHFGTNPPFVHNFVYAEHEVSRNGALTNFHDSFHTYCIEWDPTQVRYYVDGAHLYTVRDSNIGNFLTNQQTDPMRLIINTAIGGNFLPNPNASTVWPQLFEIDYAWVYDRVGEPTLRVENRDFEKNGGSLANWSLFGSRGGNISSDNSYSLSGDSSLKVFGQFNSAQNYSGIEQGLSVKPGEELNLSANVYVDAADPLNANQAFLKIDFYNEQYGAFDSNEYISSQQILLANSSTASNQWVHRQFTTTAPAGAVEARAVIVFEQNNFTAGSVYVDDIEFTGKTTVETINPSLVNLENGKILTGNESNLTVSDDEYLEILAGALQIQNTGPVSAVVQATSPFISPSQIEFKLEAAANTFGLTQKIAALNFETGQLDVIDERMAGLEDTVVIEGDLSSVYVNPANRLMLFRVSWEAQQPVLFYPWKIRLDEISWTISE